MPFTARWSGKCRICAQPFHAGDQIALPSGYGVPVFAHALCVKLLNEQRASALAIEKRRAQ